MPSTRLEAQVKRAEEKRDRRKIDIDELKHVLRELRQAKEFMAQAQRLSHTGSFSWRLDTGEIAWSEEMNRIYDFLHDFLDFENAKRLIVYGIVLIVMMIIRPDGILTRDSLRRLSFMRPKARHA